MKLVSMDKIDIATAQTTACCVMQCPKYPVLWLRNLSDAEYKAKAGAQRHN